MGLDIQIYRENFPLLSSTAMYGVKQKDWAWE